MRRASDIFSEDEIDKKAAALKAWLGEIGSRNFEKVPLNSEKLDNVSLIIFCLFVRPYNVIC